MKPVIDKLLYHANTAWRVQYVMKFVINPNPVIVKNTLIDLRQIGVCLMHFSLVKRFILLQIPQLFLNAGDRDFGRSHPACRPTGEDNSSCRL